MTAVALQNVSHRFAGTWVLARLQLQLPIGGRLLLTGDNGAGKTTLLRLAATALRPTRGSVHVFGHDATRSPIACRRRLSLMTHQHFFYEALNAVDNLRLALRLAGKPVGPIARALSRVGLSRVGSAPVAAFSAGMKRRLALARTILLDPELVLLDEPFSQLDPGGVALVERLLAELATRGTSWILSTHDAARARPLCNQHVHLRSQVAAAPTDVGGAP